MEHLVSVMVRTIAIFFGIVLLVFGVADLLMPRAHFISSNPGAGSIIAEPPQVVVVNFSSKLAPESSMDVTSTIRMLPDEQIEYLEGNSVVMKAELNADDASGKSMRAHLGPGLHKGLYWISWRATTPQWRSTSYGRTYFTVGMPAPESLTRAPEGVVDEHNYQWRSRRATIVGGFVMLLLGLYLWVRSPVSSKVGKTS